MSLKATLEMLNRMQSESVIEKYAIGGAVGATFYLEPSATEDVDVFVLLPTKGALLSLAPIYEYLTSYGCSAEGTHVIIADWPVQFLPVNDTLDQEALGKSVKTEVEGVPTWVFTAEHLVAMALRTGRSKDHARILQFLESGVVDRDKLGLIVARHALTHKWEQFSRRYLEQ